jgi:phosphoserine phosphatase RsbU/P
MAPVRHSFPWCPGDRVLRYTDGLIDARNSDHHFLPIAAVYPSLAADSREACLDAVIDLLRRRTGGRPGDDSPLLLADHRPHARLPGVDEPQAGQAPAAG